VQETKLDTLVSAYRSSGEGRDLVLEKVAAQVYDAHRRYGFDDEDDAANALLKFRGRIAKLVDRFEDRGVPFDAYLASCLRYLARTARRERRRASERESVCERAVFEPGDFDEGELSPEGSQAGEERIEPEEGSRPAVRRRPRARGGRIPRCPAEEAAYSSRLVFLALKCAWEIDDEGIARVAASAGVGREWLAAAVEQARRSLACERARVESLSQRRNRYWTGLRLLELRIAEEPDPYRRARLESTRARETQRLESVKSELSALRTIVPNSVVARILGVPKGTVDSGLYYLRKHYGPGPL
jgi:hypothetical protein